MMSPFYFNHLEIKGRMMKHYKLFLLILLFLTFAANIFAGDKEDIFAALNNFIEAFNKYEVQAYF